MPKLNQTGFSPILLIFLIVVGIVAVIMLILFATGVYVYVTRGSKAIPVAQSLQKSQMDIPKDNIHWDKAQELFEQIKTEEDPVKYNKIQQEIVIEIKQVLEEEADNARVWYELGNAYSWVSGGGDPKSAEAGLTAYKKAEELEPNNILYINGVGDQLILMKKYDEAILQFQKTLRLTPRSGYANLSLCKAYIGAKVYDSATESCQSALDIFTKENKDGSYDKQVLETKKVMAGIPK